MTENQQFAHYWINKLDSLEDSSRKMLLPRSASFFAGVVFIGALGFMGYFSYADSAYFQGSRDLLTLSPKSQLFKEEQITEPENQDRIIYQHLEQNDNSLEETTDEQADNDALAVAAEETVVDQQPVTASSNDEGQNLLPQKSKEENQAAAAPSQVQQKPETPIVTATDNLSSSAPQFIDIEGLRLIKPITDGGWLIQLASFKSLEPLNTAWKNFNVALPNFAVHLNKSEQRNVVNGAEVFRLRAGYFKDSQAASSWCEAFKKRNINCLVTNR